MGHGTVHNVISNCQQGNWECLNGAGVGELGAPGGKCRGQIQPKALSHCNQVIRNVGVLGPL